MKAFICRFISCLPKRRFGLFYRFITHCRALHDDALPRSLATALFTSWSLFYCFYFLAAPSSITFSTVISFRHTADALMGCRRCAFSGWLRRLHDTFQDGWGIMISSICWVAIDVYTTRCAADAFRDADAGRLALPSAPGLPCREAHGAFISRCAADGFHEMPMASFYFTHSRRWLSMLRAEIDGACWALRVLKSRRLRMLMLIYFSLMHVYRLHYHAIMSDLFIAACFPFTGLFSSVSPIFCRISLPSIGDAYERR